jgi:multidrug efflux pump subunit AcrA (membrane-fusion protein)
MKKVGLLICAVMMFGLLVTACGSNAGISATATPVASANTVIAEGHLVPSRNQYLAFQASGKVGQILVKKGDQVKADDVLATLVQDSTQIALESAVITAQQNLAVLTTPESIANAKLTITTAQTNVTNAQLALNNLKYWQNTALVQNYYANMVLAKSNLDKAQTAYDNAKGGQYINNANQAAAYNALYTAQVAYNNAKYYYSLYSQAPTQNQQDQAQANLDLANATLKSAQVYLAALTGGTVPADASGTALLQLKQDQLAVQTAQANLNASELTAPFDGTIMDINISSNQTVGPGTWAVAIADTSQWFVDTSDLNELDVVKVSLGQTVNITADALPGVKMSGVVEEIGNTPVNQGTDVLYTVHILLSNPDARLRWGMTMEVTFNTKK